MANSNLLIPRGIKEMARVAASFLKRKLAEFDALKNEIEILKREVAQPMPAEED